MKSRGSGGKGTTRLAKSEAARMQDGVHFREISRRRAALLRGSSFPRREKLPSRHTTPSPSLLLVAPPRLVDRTKFQVVENRGTFGDAGRRRLSPCRGRASVLLLGSEICSHVAPAGTSSVSPASLLALPALTGTLISIETAVKPAVGASLQRANSV